MTENNTAVEQQQTQTTQAAPEAPKPVVKNKYANRRRRKKMPKAVALLLTAGIIGGIAYGTYYFTTVINEPAESEIITGNVMTTTLTDYVEGWGTISPKETSEYGATTRGTVTEVAVMPNQTVTAGDLLFVIDPESLKAELETAQEKLDNALEELTDAAAAIDDTGAKSPISGKMITASDIEVGDSVTEGQVIGTIVDDSEMLLELYVSRGYFDSVKIGQTANVSIASLMTNVEGVVHEIDDIEKPIDGALCFRVVISVPNAAGTLAKDDAGTASINTDLGEVMPADSGTFEYAETVEVKMPTAGEVSFVNLLEFGKYSSGQVICSVDTQSLLDTLADKQEAYDTAQEEYDEINAEVQNTHIYSEITGLVTAVVIEPGDKLEGSGTAVITVSNTESLLLNIRISDLDMPMVTVGMPVDVTNDNGAYAMGTLTDISFEAEVEGDSWSGMVATFPATVSLSNDGSMLPGTGVNYTMTAIVKENVLAVPNQAIIYTEFGSVVFVKDDGLTSYERVELDAELVPEGFYPVLVEAGVSDPYNTEIISGLDDMVEIYLGTAGSQDGFGGMYW